MTKHHQLDEKDRQIISLLMDDPEASQSHIATQVNLSQPSVGSRIHRLKENGAISFRVGMDLKRVGLHMAKIEITARNIETVLDRFKACPFFINGLMVSGKHNLCMFLVGEDISTLEALVEHHVRRDPEVSSVSFNVVTNSSNEIIVPVTLSLNKKDGPPCSHDCKCDTCSSYEIGRCTGCPMTEYYRGSFWA